MFDILTYCWGKLRSSSNSVFLCTNTKNNAHLSKIIPSQFRIQAKIFFVYNIFQHKFIPYGTIYGVGSTSQINRDAPQNIFDNY